jgi:hypothetical protein
LVEGKNDQRFFSSKIFNAATKLNKTYMANISGDSSEKYQIDWIFA